MVNYNDGEIDSKYTDQLNKYESNLRFKKSFLEVLTLNTRGLKALMHPIRLRRTYEEIDRIDDVMYNYLKMKHQDLFEFVTEESGDVGLDLQNARLKFKPQAMVKFAEENPVFVEEIDKKLIKIRNK